MNPIIKLIRGDDARKTRFHTVNGHFCPHLVQFLRALTSTIARISLKRYSRSPWLVYSATSYIAPAVIGKRIFEFGSGMSSLWFSEHGREVFSVENDSIWFEDIARQAKNKTNLRLVYAASKAEYLGAVRKAGGLFDIILIDGEHRKECVEIARSFLNPNGVVIVDNTDAYPILTETIQKVFGDGEIRTFRGWAPGILHPNETTVVENIPVQSRV